MENNMGKNIRFGNIRMDIHGKRNSWSLTLSQLQNLDNNVSVSLLLPLVFRR